MHFFVIHVLVFESHYHQHLISLKNHVKHHQKREDIGTLSIDDDHGSENVGKKRICVLSILIASIWTRSICQLQATFPGAEFLRILFRFKNRKEKIRRRKFTSSIKTAILEVSRRSRAMDIKEFEMN